MLYCLITHSSAFLSLCLGFRFLFSSTMMLLSCFALNTLITYIYICHQKYITQPRPCWFSTFCLTFLHLFFQFHSLLIFILHNHCFAKIISFISKLPSTFSAVNVQFVFSASLKNPAPLPLILFSNIHICRPRQQSISCSICFIT